MISLYKYNIPTVDIYFNEPLKAYISEWTTRSSKRPIHRLGPYSYYANNKVVIIRYVTDKELRKIHSLQPKQCYYFIDDNLFATAEDLTLPDDYRARLATFTKRQLPKILTLADTVVTPNPVINNSYSDKRKLLLHPAYTHICRDFSHFENTKSLNILFCGTRSHLNDLLFIKDVMIDICQRYNHVKFITYLGHHVPADLSRQPNTIHHSSMTWPRFKRLFGVDRYHIGIAPYTKTAFNCARSTNKILDHAAFGAAGIYTDQPPNNNSIIHRQNGLLVGEKAEDWYEAIEGLIKDVPLTCQLARAGASLAADIGDPKVVRDFWLKELFECGV